MRRALKYAAGILLVLVLTLGILVAVLALTAPGPRLAEGWDRLPDMPDPRGEVAMAVAQLPNGPRLYVLGGISGLGSTVTTVFVYDPVADAWSAGPALPEPRDHAAGAALDDTVYVSGGSPGATAWAPTTTFWSFGPGNEAWQEHTEMLEGRAGHGMVALNGRLYVVGGEGPSSQVLLYDPENDAWSTGAEMPAQRDHLVVLVVGEEIWAIGGRASFGELMARVDIYDPHADSWREGPPLPEPMSAMAGGVLSTGIHIVGGEDPTLFGGVQDRHYRLDPGSERWESMRLPIAAVHGVPGAVIDDRLLIAGGATRQGALSVLAWTGVTQAYPGR